MDCRNGDTTPTGDFADHEKEHAALLERIAQALEADGSREPRPAPASGSGATRRNGKTRKKKKKPGN